MQKLALAIFDLDGVLVDTAKFHYKAWNRLAEEKFNFHLSQRDYERFKGVSRTTCMDIICELSGCELSMDEKQRYAEQKNAWYLEYIQGLSERELLAGAAEIFNHLRRTGVKVALGSASRNAKVVLQMLGIEKQFDVIVDGTLVSKAKPNPEVFLKVSEMLGISPGQCIVFEDAYAGIEAAHAGGMYGFGIGRWEDLPNADFVAPDLLHIPLKLLF